MPSPASRTRLVAGVVLAAALALGGTACSSDDASSDASSGATTTAAPTTSTAPAGSVSAVDGWARTSPMVSGAGAAYLVLTGGATDEQLVSASVPATVAATAELHETTMSMGNASGETTGSMSMRQVASIAVPAGGTVTFEPGGYHVMLKELTTPLVAGQTFELTLGFASGAQLVVPVTVRAS